MRFLIDTNVVISAEPTRSVDIESATPDSLDLIRHAAGVHQLLVHPTLVDEIAKDRDVERRAMRLIAVNRYPRLEHPPNPTRLMLDAVGVAEPGSHDWFDNLLLACVVGNAVHGLITEDGRIHRKARRIGVADRVHTVVDAVAMLSSLADAPPSFIPSVTWRPVHSLSLDDPFFESLRSDYLGFDGWFERAAREGRCAFVIDGPAGEIAGLCALKPDDDEYNLGGRVAKVSTIKVGDSFKGSRYGELLLKALFLHASSLFDALWVTVFPKHEELIDLLSTFGFVQHCDRGEEQVMVKRVTPPGDVPRSLDPLSFHIAFGPPALLVTEEQTFIVPIQPGYHQSLFPDAPGEQQTFLPPRGYGNALRKAYLCRASLRRARPGATLVFYRSDDAMAATAIGVLEETLVSADPVAILEFVGTRTVYSVAEVEKMAARGEVLAMLFRQDRFLDPPIPLRELQNGQAVRRAPQTTVSVRKEGVAWLRQRIAE